jgi:hypothetical protein
MTRAPFLFLVLIISMMMGLAAPVDAQQTPDTAKSPEPAKSSPTTPSDTATPAATAPSATTDAPAPAPKFEVHFIPAAAATPDVPSEDVLKKARSAGYHTKVSHGVLYFCRKEAETGSRFTKENCVNEDQLAQVFERQQAQRDQLSNHTCSGGGCAGK